MKDLLILRGAPGVGKSSAGKRLAKYYKNGITIEIDEVRRMINSVSWTDVKEHLDAIKATASLVNSYYKSGYKPVIVVDTLSQGSINVLLNNLSLKIKYKIFSLTAENKIIKKRIKKRNDGFMDYDISFKVNASIMKDKLKKNYPIDTTYINSKTICDKIINIF